MSEYDRRPDALKEEPESGQTMGTAQQTQGGRMEQAQQYAGQAREKAGEYGQRAQEQADAGKDQAAAGMERAAGTVREKMGGGAQGEAGARIAEGMESAAGYLRAHDTSEMLNDLETYARNHPGQALAGAVATGFILGRLLR